MHHCKIEILSCQGVFSACPFVRSVEGIARQNHKLWKDICDISVLMFRCVHKGISSLFCCS